CGDAVGFSLSTRRRCKGRRQAEKAGVTPRIARTILRSLRSTLQFAERDLWNIASVRLDTGELHHLGPLFGFLCDQLAELRRRSRQRHAAEVGETGLHLGVGESRIDLFVELVD